MNTKTTKETLKYIVENWDSKSLSEIAAGVGQSVANVKSTVIKLRKAGFDLPSKEPKRQTMADLIAEFSKEQGIQSNQ